MDIYNTKPRKIKCVRNDDDVWGGGGENPYWKWEKNIH